MSKQPYSIYLYHDHMVVFGELLDIPFFSFINAPDRYPTVFDAMARKQGIFLTIDPGIFDRSDQLTTDSDALVPLLFRSFSPFSEHIESIYVGSRCLYRRNLLPSYMNRIIAASGVGIFVLMIVLGVFIQFNERALRNVPVSFLPNLTAPFFDNDNVPPPSAIPRTPELLYDLSVLPIDIESLDISPKTLALSATIDSNAIADFLNGVKGVLKQYSLNGQSQFSSHNQSQFRWVFDASISP